MQRADVEMGASLCVEPERVRNYGLAVGRAMRRLHMLDAGGAWQTGVAGFVELWTHLPYYRRLANLIRVLHLVGPLDWLYGHWAEWRLKCRCRDQQCGPPGG